MKLAASLLVLLSIAAPALAQTQFVVVTNGIPRRGSIGTLQAPGWVGTAATDLNMAGKAVTNLSSGSRFTNGLGIASFDNVAGVSYTFTNSQSSASIQSIIDSAPRVGKVGPTFIFAPGTYTNYNLVFQGFSLVKVRGQVYTDSLNTNQTTIFDNSTGSGSLTFMANGYAELSGVKVIANSATSGGMPLIIACPFVWIGYSSFFGTNNTQGTLLNLTDMSSAKVAYCAFANSYYAIYAQNGAMLYIAQCSKTSSVPCIVGVGNISGFTRWADYSDIATVSNSFGWGGFAILPNGTKVP